MWIVFFHFGPLCVCVCVRVYAVRPSYRRCTLRVGISLCSVLFSYFQTIPLDTGINRLIHTTNSNRITVAFASDIYIFNIEINYEHWIVVFIVSIVSTAVKEFQHKAFYTIQFSSAKGMNRFARRILLLRRRRHHLRIFTT